MDSSFVALGFKGYLWAKAIQIVFEHSLTSNRHYSTYKRLVDWMPTQSQKTRRALGLGQGLGPYLHCRPLFVILY